MSENKATKVNAATELSTDDLEKVSGGIADLRTAPKEKTTEISDNTKSKA